MSTSKFHDICHQAPTERVIIIFTHDVRLSDRQEKKITQPCQVHGLVGHFKFARLVIKN